jgi:hypothetical protein
MSVEGKKAQEIKKEVKSEEIQIQQEDQKNKLLDVDRAGNNIKVKEADGDAIPVNAEERQMLFEVREDFQENMPQEAHIEEKANVEETELTELPSGITAAIDEILGWRKTKAETSVPVKNAAQALKDAKNDVDAAAAMADLAVACSLYMDKNAGKFFKSSRRKQVVTNLLNEMADFIAQADIRYYENYELAIDKLVSETQVSFERRLSEATMDYEKAGSLEDAISKKKERIHSRESFILREEARLEGESDLEEEEKDNLSLKTKEDRKK